ncbi:MULTISPECIES: pitrilysin family protein [unclassified Massilia]|uniref:M16 family metallopeptidase n=1 Tax=unclassified Massilia TaxID=2609279 RepID=UPI0017832DCE|nr:MULTISPECIES: pitrilysin family protein [unclassified Massilia]MBD8532507.1 insulinase family protein [Massilia sp. CFBP 13647]MBD8675877.1 insulinase family protein [Massilia sp. CFBP 13721]
MKKLMLTLAISMMFAPAAFAEAPAVQAAGAPDRAMPPYGADKPIPTPKIVKKTLSNGMTVWVVPRQGLPRVDYVLAVRGAGFAADDKDHPGFANILAGMINEGSAKRDSRAIAEAAQGMGGSVAAGPASDGIVVQANAVASQAGPMMALLAEVTRTPSFPVKEVELTKANALQALRAAEATPAFRAERAVNQAVYGEHPYGHTQPTAAAITSVTQDMLRGAHAQRFRPDRALLVITGSIKEAEAMKLAQAAFGDWKAQGQALAEPAAPARAAKPARILLERGGSVQSTIRVGGPGIAASADEQVPLRLASTILGGGFSSRVNINLREAKGYTYGASAGARMNRAGGAIIGGADVRNEVTGAALTEYLNEYKRIGSELVPADEMTMNKRYVAGGYLISNQLQASVASTLARNWLIGLPPEFLGQYVPLIQKVTPQQVRNVSKKYFAPEAQSIVVVGDPKAVGEQLKAFGEFTVSDK